DRDEALLEASRCLNCRRPRCVEACPVHIDIPGFIHALISEGEGAAASIISKDSSLPSVCGRVCPQETQCEGSCVLGIKSEPVAIGKLERYVGDWKIEQFVNTASASEDSRLKTEDSTPRNGKKVAVIGSGPAGLACASDLARWGYEVKVFEALHQLGGVLVYGIPEFRLPKEKIVAKEIEAVKRLGVEFVSDVIVGRTTTIDRLLDEEGFDAVFVGSGAGLPRFMGIEGENLNGVFSANEFLTRVNLMHAYDQRYDTPVFQAKKVVVVGGGNVAMDAVRTAKRLGAESVIVYRRSEAELPARREEVHHAKEEGIEFRMLTNPVRVLGDDKGWVRGLECVEMELGEPDESGRRSPVEKPGSNFELECDAVIMALGTSPNPLIKSTTKGLDVTRRGCLVADEDGRTSRPRVFAGGDAVTGAATVILAMGAGRRAAKAIHESLKRP
ncbi:MAG: NADPH-dependent glutamate synthase, partial [Muribaculaceae bacterium]|nr:NADPH-dependent glutamate synthase [Muribaculaceae bacterium]